MSTDPAARGWNNVDMANRSTKTKKTSSTALQLRTKVRAGCVGGGCTVGGIGNHNAPAKARARLQLRTKVKAGCVGPSCTLGGLGNHNETLVDRSLSTRRARGRG
jgi:hypothetical protein